MAKIIATKAFGMLTEKGANWLGKHFDVVNSDSIPTERVVDHKSKDGRMYSRPKEFWYKYLNMQRAKNKIWMQVCSETSDPEQREQLMFERWQGVI